MSRESNFVVIVNSICDATDSKEKMTVRKNVQLK
jgi:hypothetical protein